MPTSATSSYLPVLRASASGGTALAAFHSALVAAGIGHYNLIRLSSVIPAGCTVDATGKAATLGGAWGDRLYCVYAEQRATEVGEQAWAGIGWVERLDGGGGLFVEHEGSSEELVTQAIRASLTDMVADQPDAFTTPDWVVNGAVCVGLPVCSIVVAPFECASWAGAR